MNKQSAITHVGFIMDGNRRYATSKGLEKIQGHQYGVDTLFRVLDWCNEEHVKEVSVYALSTENWKRSKREVAALLQLIENLSTERKEEFFSRNIRVRFIGDLSRFSKKIQHHMNELQEQTKRYKKVVNVCISYGGRSEILNAVNTLLQESRTRVTEKQFEKYLWSGVISEPEVIIRTGGDKRLSNFLLWKSAYSEIYFTNTLWPDFTKKELVKIFNAYRDQARINKGK